LHNEQLAKYYSGNEIEKNKMGGSRSTYGERRGAHRVLVGNLSARDHLEDLGIDGMIILEWIFKK
jgi:hypothetical protein